MSRAVGLRLDAIQLVQDRRVLTATALAPPLNFVTTELIRALFEDVARRLPSGPDEPVTTTDLSPVAQAPASRMRRLT